MDKAEEAFERWYRQWDAPADFKEVYRRVFLAGWDAKADEVLKWWTEQVRGMMEKQ